MSDGYGIRKYRKKTSLEPVEIERWYYSVVVALLAITGIAVILLALHGA